jgi:hypothetical protein
VSTPGSASGGGAGAKTRTAPLISGEFLGKIHIPETVANLFFGGTFRNRPYICGFEFALRRLYERARRA